MKELNLREIQTASLDVLLRTERIIREYNLQCFLAYGTLLGAVRHQGFIPWDDDIDIWMPRKDVNKLIEIMDKNQKKYYPLKLVTRKNTPNYDYGIPRITDLSYIYQNNETKKKKVEMGVFIDIYPLDNYGSDINSGNKLYSYASKLSTKYIIYVNPVSFSNKFHTAGKYLYSKLLHIWYGNHWDQTIDEDIERFIGEKSSDSDRYVGVPTWDPFGMRQYERSLFSGGNKLLFEGHEFNVPNQYDKILTTLYGNYMKLPPAEERIPHHNYKVWSNKADKVAEAEN